MSANHVDGPITTCPDCGCPLNFTLPGFRPATRHEIARLDPTSVRLLGMCANPGCPTKVAASIPRSPRG